ncbi:MAG: hypothetical protein U0931_37115 [Vulcanimicrobiota bacterium]
MLISTVMDSRSLATLLLVGDTSLSQRLRMGIHEVTLGAHQLPPPTEAVDLVNTGIYIQHHVKAAGYRGDALFSDGFIAKAHTYTRGTLVADQSGLHLCAGGGLRYPVQGDRRGHLRARESRTDEDFMTMNTFLGVDNVREGQIILGLQRNATYG